MKLRDGKAGENTLDRSVWKRISGAGVRGRKVTMSADPVTLEVSMIGQLAVYAAVNALSANRIIPESFRPVILLPQGSQEERLRQIMDQICEVCVREGLVIEGGHTEVTGAVTRPVVIGSCTGTAMEPYQRPADNKKEDEESRADGIVMTKWAGMEASCILAQERQELGGVFPESILLRMRMLQQYLSVRREARICALMGAEHLVDLSEGGIYAALWRLSAAARRGLRVDMASIPMLQETIEFANYYDIDPYKMRSAGSLLAVTKEPERLIEELESSRIPAVRIGELTGDHDKILINGDEIRYLDLPQPDELHKVLNRC